MKKSTKLIILVLAIAFLIFVIAAIATGVSEGTTASKNTTNSTNTKPKETLSLEEVFSVTSNVQNVLLQTYKTTVKAKIRNNTDKALENVVFNIGVETTTLKNQGSYALKIPYIAPNSVYTVNNTVDSDQNFENITSLSYSINGGAVKSISNVKATKDVDNEGISTYMIFVVLASLFMIAIVVILIVDWRKRADARIAAEVAAAHKNDDWLPWGVPVENKEKTKLEIAKIELEKEKEKSQQAKARADIEKAKVDKAKMEREKLIVCPYCGSKIKNNEGRCPNCGGDLH